MTPTRSTIRNPLDRLASETVTGGADGPSAFLTSPDFSCFAAEIRGALLVTEPGRHELALSSDDGSRLWLDGELVIDNDGDHSMRAVSASRNLSAGLHPLRIEYYNGRQDAGLVLSWTPPSADASEPVPPQHLYHPVGPLDADGDGLPGWWEALHGLDGSDPDDALLDPDADGLSNLAEFLAGTDPHLADTDGDGMPDGWEAAHGLCPFVADALDDLDGDGLTNLDEFRAGSDPHLADTDGDGLSDYEEFHGLGTDPAVCEFNANWQTVATVPAASASARSAGWFRRGTHLAAFRRGHFDIDIATETPDTLFVRVDVAHIWHATATDLPAADLSSRFLVYLGDQLLGVSTLVHAPGTPSSFIRLPLPHLPAGSHRLRVLWDGIPGGLGVCVRTVSLETPGGPDNDSDGSPDWILARSRRDDTVPEVFETHVSPVCLEGTASHPALVSIGIPDSPDPPLFATPTSSSTWYADLPLSGHGTNLFLIAFENGLRTAPASIVWTPIDIAEPDSMSLSARKGDTLLLTASSPATLVASVNGSQRPSLALAAGDTVELPIDDWGAWTLAVARPGQPAVTHSVSLFVPQWIVARLAEDGPILDVARVRPFALRALPDGGLRSGGYAEGCEIWVDELLTLGVPGDVTLRNTIVAGGIVLDDYSAIREIPGSSLPPAARLPLRFLRPNGASGSVCHSIQAYQSGQAIGWAHHAAATLPEDMK